MGALGTKGAWKKGLGSLLRTARVVDPCLPALGGENRGEQGTSWPQPKANVSATIWVLSLHVVGLPRPHPMALGLILTGPVSLSPEGCVAAPGMGTAAPRSCGMQKTSSTWEQNTNTTAVTATGSRCTERPIISINQLGEKLQKRLKMQMRFGCCGKGGAPEKLGCQGKM